MVAVCGLDKRSRPSCRHWGWATRSFEDLSTLLEVARIEYAPKFAAPETDEQLLAELDPVARDGGAAAAVRGAHARARQAGARVAGVSAGKDKATYWSILERVPGGARQGCAAAGDAGSLRVW